MKMRKLTSVLLVAVIVLIFILMAANSAGNMKPDITIPGNLKHTAVAGSHAPISIDGNKALATFVKDEGLSGDGTSASPYIIENFIIDASNAHGIELLSTDTYLIIRDCTIVGRWYSLDGIYLYNAANVNISNNSLSNNSRGIYMMESSNNTLSGNTANNNSWGIELFTSSNNTLSGNTANNNNYGIDVDHWSNNNTLSGNTVKKNSCGISVTHSNTNTLSGNTANNNYKGIDLYFSSNNMLSGNTANNNNYGIYLSHWSSYNTLSGNTANDNKEEGISLSHSSNNNAIYFNDICGNTNGQAIEEADCTDNQWDNGTTGNYWGGDYISNYPSATNDGKIWNTPYEINGTGNGIDHFPLVNAVTTTTPSWIFPVFSLTIIALLPFRRLKRRSER